MTEGLNGVSAERVEQATGRDWDAWIVAIDAIGGENLSHKEIAARLAHEHGLSGWWAQMVTVGYERAKGRRVLGQTADAGFQVGVRRTYPAPREAVWAALAGRPGLAVWLGDPLARLEPGERYSASDGTTGEIRVVKPGDRIRWTLSRPTGTSTAQIALAEPAAGKTAVTFHHEKLADAAERQAMRDHWRGVAEAIANLIAQ